MSFLQRAVTLAAMTLALAGLVNTSTPSRAADLDRSRLSVPALALPVMNPGAPLTVPTVPAQPAPSPAPALQMIQTLPARADAATPDAAHFDSLADAIAAQDVAIKDDSLRCLAGAIYFEAKGEPVAGQLAVADVIINRTRSGRFPETVCGVVTQAGQFSFVRGGEVPAIDEGRAGYRTALAVAKVALAHAWDSPAPEALYFHARRVNAGWNRGKVAAIGNHIFYR